MDKKIASALTKKQSNVVSALTTSTASRVRYLASEGFARADIARIMSVHSGKSVSYQWVKNVLDKVANAA